MPQTDVLFVPSGGKSAMPKLAAALRAVKVPLVVTPDLDILRDTETLRRLLETLDADWATVGADLERCTQDIRSSLAPSLATVTYRLEAALKQANEARDGSLPMDRDVRAILLSEIRASHDRWQQLKEYGVAAFRGEARVTANRLLDNLDSAGIVPVRVGELERFAPDLGISKGKRWLPTALQAQAYRSENVQEHLQHILRHLPAPSPR